METSENTQKIIEQIGKLTVLELAELVKALEAKEGKLELAEYVFRFSGDQKQFISRSPKPKKNLTTDGSAETSPSKTSRRQARG